jgi:hypothetical protein
MRSGMGRGGLAGDGVLQHVLADQEHVVLEQGALHLLPAAGDAALHQRAMAPMAPNMPPMMSLTLVPARSGSPGRPVM